jgi:hypothetical protein
MDRWQTITPRERVERVDRAQLDAWYGQKIAERMREDAPEGRALGAAGKEDEPPHDRENDSEEQTPPESLRRPIHWTRLTLYFADGNGLTSTWQPAEGCAMQSGSTPCMDREAASEEHLRALAEIRAEGGATNWFLNPELSTEGCPRAEDIDWTGFTFAEEL